MNQKQKDEADKLIQEAEECIKQIDEVLRWW